ncbi:amidohydrolase [Bifidobacterium anseris]|uniref:Amidohydrolase n=1 Tax=Bifidobacterium anseris TaxID=2020963 RepID=A0A2N5IYN1_9BIFI|nr:amidohydrolase family protein [Bifidobacterium anseris]PLS27050.1 amidohydrolase [Bifidobacterium anseris]
MTLQVIDAHLHIWDPDTQDLPWLAGLPALRNRYTIDDLAAHYAAQHDVEFLGGVYVEVDAADPLLEDRLLYENTSPLILRRVMRTRVSPYMRIPVIADGIREPLHVASEPRGRVGEKGFLDGLRILAELGLPFDLCNRGDELPDMAQALAAVPEETVVIDHLGNMPGLDEASKQAMRALGELPNVYVKVSGDNPVDPHVVEFVREAFGPGKLMYASNWPVVELNSSFDAHFSLMRDLFGDDEDFFMRNACRAYGIDMPQR